MSRFETLPSGERVNVDHIVRGRVLRTTADEWEVRLTLSSGETIRAGAELTEAAAEDLLNRVTAGPPAMFDGIRLVPSEIATARQIRDHVAAGGLL